MVYLLNMMMFHVAKCFLNDQRVISYIWRATRALSAGTSAAGLWWPWLSTASAAHERPGSDIGHPQIHCQNSPSTSSRWCLSRSNLHGEASTSWPWNFHGWASFPISCTGCLRTDYPVGIISTDFAWFCVYINSPSEKAVRPTLFAKTFQAAHDACKERRWVVEKLHHEGGNFRLEFIPHKFI